MKIDTLKKRLATEFNFSEAYEALEMDDFNPGTILLTPHYRERQRPWMTKAYDEWMKGDRTIVLVAPLKLSCRYFKRYLTDVAEVRHIKEHLTYNNDRATSPMIIAIYRKRLMGEPNFVVTFD
jgi:hypothetical protein